jgi:acyl carrier protein
MEENIIYRIEIFQLIESKYNIEIKDEEVENISTLEDLIELVKIKQKNEYTNRYK